MFGSGIYFADCSSKSANYCHLERNLAQNKLDESIIGWMFLSEVALGQSYDYLQAEYGAAELCKANNRGSVRGKGEIQPCFFSQ
jgi:poly [ADP-ribose] polymerase